ncbi:MAG TPA: SUMF1/EgtB/PvdO family nonheme iron enzyme, partial [Terriglobia bacterium]|nr:SUMF1/EgtB/PvdO family nonheme iron enzyme [Terriglobia bacterium]
MKLSSIGFIILVWLLGSAQVVSAAPGVLTHNLDLLPGSGSCNQKVSKNNMRGIGAEPAAASLQAATAAKSEPMTKQELLQLVAAHLSNQRIAELLRNLGIDFQPDDAYLSSLRRAGANEQLITLVREASVTTGALTVQTVPNAQVFVDGNLRGQADAQGMLEIRAKIGAHTLKVSQAGMQDFQQSVTVTEGAPTLVVAPLAELGGSVRVKALPGATVWLDGPYRGTIGSSGELLLSEVSPGPHRLRVTAPGKVHDLRSIVVAGGAETAVFVRLADALRANPQDGLKYVWIAPGNFLMGCSPGDNDCADPEKPAHLVTLPRAYWIGQTEVTVGAYKLFVNAGKVKMPAAPKFDRGWKNDGFPMANVNWDEASQYCGWAGGR